MGTMYLARSRLIKKWKERRDLALKASLHMATSIGPDQKMHSLPLGSLYINSKGTSYLDTIFLICSIIIRPRGISYIRWSSSARPMSPVLLLETSKLVSPTDSWLLLLGLASITSPLFSLPLSYKTSLRLPILESPIWLASSQPVRGAYHYLLTNLIWTSLELLEKLISWAHLFDQMRNLWSCLQILGNLTGKKKVRLGRSPYK